MEWPQPNKQSPLLKSILAISVNVLHLLVILLIHLGGGIGNKDKKKNIDEDLPLRLTHQMLQALLYHLEERINVTHRHMRLARAWRQALKFKEGKKNITFLRYDGTYGQTDKVLSFIQCSIWRGRFHQILKACHVAIYLQNFAYKWWANPKLVGL